MSNKKHLLLAIIYLLTGAVIGWNIYSAQVQRSYEDGSFVGCTYLGTCND